jgi:hypothetical protein
VHPDAVLLKPRELASERRGAPAAPAAGARRGAGGFGLAVAYLVGGRLGVRVTAAAAAIAVGGVVLAVVATLAPTAALGRLTVPRVLAEE